MTRLELVNAAPLSVPEIMHVHITLGLKMNPTYNPCSRDNAQFVEAIE